MFIKITENKVEIAPKDLNDGERLIFGYGNDIDLLLSEGWRKATEDESELINLGFAVVVDGSISDVRLTPEYIEAQNIEIRKQIIEKYQTKFEELKSAYLAKIGMGTANETTYRTQYAAVRTELLNELNNVGA